MTDEARGPELDGPAGGTPVVTRLMFLPVRAASKRIAPRLSARLFERIWSMIGEDEPPPRAEQREAPFGKLALALALEGACAAIVSGLLDNASRRKFARVTGRWPGRRAKS
jgi:hypothetical protein